MIEIELEIDDEWKQPPEGFNEDIEVYIIFKFIRMMQTSKQLDSGWSLSIDY